eukprot:scaffold118934_cov23-Tisochrysis_lutea.AAC.1
MLHAPSSRGAPGPIPSLPSAPRAGRDQNKTFDGTRPRLRSESTLDVIEVHAAAQGRRDR